MTDVGATRALSMAEAVGGVQRDTYRHGDLYRALLDAGTELARAGGPDAVVLREATRPVGVAPERGVPALQRQAGAARGGCSCAQSSLAVAMEAAQEKVTAPEPAEAARARLRAVGTGYLLFARGEPGLFRTAFSVPHDLLRAADTANAGTAGLTPFQLLTAALDEMVATGLMSAKRRQGAEYLAWSAVHGLAVLLIEGPLRSIAAREVADIGGQLLDMVDQGLSRRAD